MTTPRGTTFDIPAGYVPREADNGAGIVYQAPGAPGNVGSIRIMEPTDDYTNGYFRYYNSEGPGQPVGINGKPGRRSRRIFQRTSRARSEPGRGGELRWS